MSYEQLIYEIIQQQTDLQLGSVKDPIFGTGANTYTRTTATGDFIYAVQADNQADVVFTSAKDMTGTAISAMVGWTIPAGGTLIAPFSEVVLASGTYCISLRQRVNPQQNEKP